MRTVRVVRGMEAVLAMQGLLDQMGRRTGQQAATNWISYFMRSPGALLKTPCLLLVGCGAKSGPAPGAEELQGAVLVYEYVWKGWETKVFATDDTVGVRTVIAPEGARIEVAAAAMQELMAMGAVAVLITVDSSMCRREPGCSFPMLTRTRTVPLYLPLANSLEATLATLGDNTRRNFRRYRRRAEADLGAEFVAEVEMGRLEFLEMNRRSTNPAEEATVEWRYDLLERTGRHETMFAGVRAADGRWLSLIGGRRDGLTTEIDWQINLAGLARYSLSTVMRAFLLEDEIARGTQRLWFEGGTPHPMRHSFAVGEATDLLWIRAGSVRAWALQRFARWIFPEKNFLRAALREMRGIATELPNSSKRDLDRIA
jgi:hypothetical protein